MDLALAGLDSMYWPPTYAEVVADHPDARLVGYTDLGVDDAEVEANIGSTPDAFADEWGLTRFSDLTAAVDAVDGVIVCTRNSRAPGVAAVALEAGRHAFVTKPIGVDVDDLRAIRDALSPEVVFSAGRSAYGYPSARTVLSVVDDGEIGDVHTLRVMHNHGRLREWAAGTWYTEPAEGNGSNYLGWYPLHFAVEVFGPIAKLWGCSQSMPAWDREMANRDWETPDHFKALAKHENGRVSTVEVYCDIGDWDVGGLEVEVVGTEGVVRYSAPGDEVRVHTDAGVRAVPFEAERRPQELDVLDVERWIAACVGDGRPAIDAEDALHVAAAGCAWNEATARESRHARVDLRPGRDE